MLVNKPSKPCCTLQCIGFTCLLRKITPITLTFPFVHFNILWSMSLFYFFISIFQTLVLKGSNEVLWYLKNMYTNLSTNNVKVPTSQFLRSKQEQQLKSHVKYLQCTTFHLHVVFSENLPKW